MLFSGMLALMASWFTPTCLFLLLNVMIGTIFLISRLSPPKTLYRPKFGYDGGYNSSSLPFQRAPSLLHRFKSFNFSTYKFPLSNQDFDNYHLQPSDSLARHPLKRGPSILERVKSINFSFCKYSPQSPDTDYIHPTEHDDYPNPQPLRRAPSLLERVKSIDFTSFYKSDSVKSNQSTEPSVTEEAYISDTDMSPVHGQVKTLQSESKVIQRKLPEKMKESASENSRRKAEKTEKEEEAERRRPATTRIEKTVSFEDDDDQGVDAKADDFINKFKQQLKLQRLDSLLHYGNICSRASN